MAAHQRRPMMRRQRGRLRLTALVCLGVFASACAGPAPLYSWGRYESILWEGYQAQGDPATHVTQLEEDVQKALAEGKRVPPGVHAHIGFLRFASGDLPAAREHFLKERELFPESAVFIDGVLERMQGGEGLPEPPAVPKPAEGDAPAQEQEDQS